MVLCSLASYQSSEVVEAKAETPSNRGRTHETNNCVLHRSPQWCNNKQTAPQGKAVKKEK